MKAFIAVLMAFSMLAAAGAQDSVGNADPNMIGRDTAQQKLQTVIADKFEVAGFWNVHISTDQGVATGRLFEGGPTAKADEPESEQAFTGVNPEFADKYVLGIRADFFRRGQNEIFITASKPIPIEGVSKTISIWVAGRNYNHTLKVIVSDFFNNKYELTMGQLNFQGWKKLTVAVPPQGRDGDSGIIQRNYHYINPMGIRIVGFKIECDQMDAIGTYYVYFDDLRVVTDLFAEDNRDEDDMADGW